MSHLFFWVFGLFGDFFFLVVVANVNLSPMCKMSQFKTKESSILFLDPIKKVTLVSVSRK